MSDLASGRKISEPELTEIFRFVLDQRKQTDPEGGATSYEYKTSILDGSVKFSSVRATR